MTAAPVGVGAIVLAGGRSSRFGRDKLAEPIDGRSMLERAIDAVREVAADVVVVAAPGANPSVPAGVRVAHDARAFEGPLAGLAAGLASLDPATAPVLVVGGDMPTLVPTVLERLLRQVEGGDIVVLDTDDGPRPLPMAIEPSRVRPAAQRLLASGERRLRALLTGLDVVTIDQATWRKDDPDAWTLRDVDVPQDLPG